MEARTRSWGFHLPRVPGDAAWEERGTSGVYFWLGHRAILRTALFLPLFISPSLGKLLSCCGGGNFYKAVSADKCRGFFPLRQACLRCFPKLSLWICDRSSPGPQNKPAEICQRAEGLRERLISERDTSVSAFVRSQRGDLRLSAPRGTSWVGTSRRSRCRLWHVLHIPPLGQIPAAGSSITAK